MRYATILLSSLLAGSICGCANPTPRLDGRFGQAVDAAKARQTADPQAFSKAPAPDGMDGAAAHEGVQRYRDSFKAPPPTFVIINPGGGGGQ